MPTCPHCGATVPEGAVYCGNCGATLSAPATSTSATTVTTQTQTSPQTPSSWTQPASSSDLQARYEKAMKRAELLGYAAAGVGVVILVVLVVLSLI
ncbi:MAG TPA: zinc ribbon domain-containing protein [Candidatus Limnocylindrales bacterium]|nr:zinc ribbon domain-containing protein [Candidatus Limnocylindrales bacterium]